MTLRTVKYNPATHKIVPLEPTTQIIQAAFNQNRSRKETKAAIPFGYELYLLGEAYLTMIAAAPEYQEPAKTMICKRCGSDRFKEHCKQPDFCCPMVATALDSTKDE